MAIDVTCPSCHTRFQVSEKFAGKSGPCPKCKTVIKVPDKSQEVVIHAPEVSGPTDSKGQAVLKPIARTEVRLKTPQIAAIIGSIVVVFIAATVLKWQPANMQQIGTILGSILLGPPLAFAGYTFLRDDELEPYRGTEVLLRSLACGLVYAAIWGAYWFVFVYLYPKPPSGWQPSWQVMAAVVPIMVALGAFAAQASFDLELTSGALDYALYLAVTVLLRVIIKRPAAAHWMSRYRGVGTEY
jgi:predicted Zn finger-like uncharacterized protein